MRELEGQEGVIRQLDIQVQSFRNRAVSSANEVQGVIIAEVGKKISPE